MKSGIISLLVFAACGFTSSAEIRQTEFIGKGTAWETKVYFRDTGRPGPTVMMIGGIHGNEPAGAQAAEQIRHWPLAKGRFIAIPRANVAGLGAHTRYQPGVPEAQRDLNRNFPGERLEAGTRGELANALWMQVLKHKPDWLFDLHEGYEFHKSHQPKPGKAKSVGSSIIYQRGELDPLVNRMLAAANETVTVPDRRFVPLSRGTKRTGLVSAAVRFLKTKGMILETTFQYQRMPIRTRQHRSMMNVALNHIGLIDQDCSDLMAPAKPGDQLFIGLYDGTGSTGRGVSNVVRSLTIQPGFTVSQLGPQDIRGEVLSQFQAVIFSGGSGSKQSATIGKEAAQAVRAYVRGGGGYLGICAGAFLCSAHYSWSLDLVDTHVFTGAREIEGKGRKQMWYRGKGTDQQMQLTAAGKKVFTGIPEHVEVRYQNGPIVSPKKLPNLPDYKVLAHFRSEKVLYPPQEGTMINTPAIVEGRFGKGRVISISPHPEATKGLESMIVHAVRAIARSR